MRKLTLNKQDNILSGNLFTSILLFSIPLMLGSLIQCLFSAADLIVLGNFASISAVSSVGVTSPIVSLLVTSATGLAGGTNAVLARYIGAKDERRVRECVGTSMFLALGFGLLLTAIAIPCALPLLRLIKCPEENLTQASLYLILYFCAIPAILVYNFGGAVLRADGDSRRPLFYLIFCGLLNVGLNLVLCLLLTQKVVAVAVATLASQVLGAVLVTVRICRMRDMCRLDLRHPALSLRMLGSILRFGFPCAVTGALYSVSNLQVQAGFNAFGDTLIAGNTAAGNVELIVDGTTGAFGMTALVYAGQNFGAGRHDRVKKTLAVSLFWGIALGLFTGFGAYLFGRPILSLYLPGEEEAIAAGIMRMKYLETTYFIISIYYILCKIMQALGYSAVPTVLMTASILGFRFVWLTYVYPAYFAGDPVGLYVCYPLSWLLTLLLLSAEFIFVWVRFLRGRIRPVSEEEKTAANA